MRSDINAYFVYERDGSDRKACFAGGLVYIGNVAALLEYQQSLVEQGG